MNITFLGAVGTVTGSKYLLTTERSRILVDCGLFQSFKPLRQRNWAPLPIDPRQLAAVVLTHAHLDHSGYIPLLVKNGFSGPIICTEATRDRCGILLPDSGYLQEQDADFANRHGYSKHKPALPLYTHEDAEASLKRFSPVRFGRERQVGPGLSVGFLPAGHILGTAIVEVKERGVTVAFSSDFGRPNSATMVDPTTLRRADYLVIESTYGDRCHDKQDPEDALAAVISATASRGGTLLVPAFAVGRALHHLKRLAPDPRNTILFTGFQAGGTRGAALVAGARRVKIHGAPVPVHATVANLEMLSAHVDQAEILGWLRSFENDRTIKAWDQTPRCGASTGCSRRGRRAPVVAPPMTASR